MLELHDYVPFACLNTDKDVKNQGKYVYTVETGSKETHVANEIAVLSETLHTLNLKVHRTVSKLP